MRSELAVHVLVHVGILLLSLVYMASADLTQPRLVGTREVPAVHLIGLAVHLTVLQVRVS